MNCEHWVWSLHSRKDGNYVKKNANLKCLLAFIEKYHKFDVIFRYFCKVKIVQISEHL